MSIYDPTPVLERIAAVTGREPKGGGGQYAARCPAHDDHQESLSFGVKPDRGLITCHRGCGRLDILNALDLSISDLFAPRDDRPLDQDGGDWMPCGHTKVADYRYRDADGNVVFGVARCDRKGNGCQGFRQWRPDHASKSGRRWSLKNADGTLAVPNVPYRLPELLAGIAKGLNVWVVEGEKDADNLAAKGVPATCNRGGGTTDNSGRSKWTAEDHARWLAGADVIIVADRDEVGRAHALHVASTLMPVARSIEIVQAAVGKDASDHLAAGQNLGQFVTVAEPKPEPNDMTFEERVAAIEATESVAAQ